VLRLHGGEGFRHVADGEARAFGGEEIDRGACNRPAPLIATCRPAVESLPT
jgi:hypothetical protein